MRWSRFDWADGHGRTPPPEPPKQRRIFPSCGGSIRNNESSRSSSPKPANSNGGSSIDQKPREEENPRPHAPPPARPILPIRAVQFWHELRSRSLLFLRPCLKSRAPHAACSLLFDVGGSPRSSRPRLTWHLSRSGCVHPTPSRSSSPVGD